MQTPADMHSHPAFGWLKDAAPRRLAEAFAAAGYELRFVGGCVRDSLLGRVPGDLDATTPAAPDAMLALCERAGLRAIPTGIGHGTITVVIGDTAIEVTTLRTDTACDGRRAEVAFTGDWQADAMRRDFTINALSLSPQGMLWDYTHGRDDLIAGRIRFIGDTDARIQEDYLRMLRFFRFLATHGQSPADTAALDACARHAPQLATLSGERIQHEMFRLLGAPDPLTALKLMASCCMLSHLGLEAAVPEALEHLQPDDTVPLPLLRLALLLRGRGEVNADAIARRWKLSRRDSDTLSLYATHRAMPHAPKPLKRQIRVHGNRDAVALLLRDAAEQALSPNDAALSQALTLTASWQAPVFPLTGKDLLAHGFSPGPHMGEILKGLEKWWEEEDYLPDRHMLLEKVKKH